MHRIIYAGTPEFAVPALEALLHSDESVVGVYTQPDRPAGRGRNLQQSPVKQFALANGLDVYQPENFKDASAMAVLRDLRADLMVVAAYGLLLPQEVLTSPRLGGVNIHASLLPRWRGASPIQQALLAGDASSGVTLMKMDAGLDTGAMIASHEIEIDPEWNASDLHDALAPLGAQLLLQNLPSIEDAIARAIVQDESQATYAPRLTKQQARVDWHKSAPQLLREVRAFNPWPVSFTCCGNDSLRLWAARLDLKLVSKVPGEVLLHDDSGVYVGCQQGVLQITELQFPGRKRCSAAAALQSRNLTGYQLGESK